MAVTPIPCAGCGEGAGGGGSDVEQNLLCDTLPDGTIAGTALAVYTYDENGNPVGAPVFIDPATGDPYVAQGTLMPCPGETGCLDPVQFCFTSTTTGPVDHPGRVYDLDLPINPGFAVDSLQIDATSYPANLTWAVTDADGGQFATSLQSFLAARFPGQTVTVDNPNAGDPVCGQALPMSVHIECARIDDGAPDLVELIYNGGRDLVVNPAYLTTPPTNLNGPQFVYLRRQDAGGTLNCTDVANQGWETNDLGDGNRDFELWGQGPGGLQTLSGTTPTPRGTPVQEITADINDTGAGPTIWQTFTVPAAGTLRAVLVHGARDAGEQHRITLSTGDTNDNQVGDIINNVTVPAQVTNAGGNTPGPWTTFEQDVALGAGVYTFAISTTNPIGANRGGLFTDMRVYVDSPDQHAAAVTEDDECVVTVEETTTSTDCQWWSPVCQSGDITSWKNAETGATLSNAAFWGQTPSPECCSGGDSGGGGGTVAAGNLVHSYPICGVVGGVSQPLQRVVYTDQSGGVLASTIIGADGGPVAPTSWVPGNCASGPPRDVEIVELCDVQGSGAVVSFLRVFTYDDAGALVNVQNQTATGAPYVTTGTAGMCSTVNREQLVLCDDDGPFLRVTTTVGGIVAASNDVELDGLTPYVPVGDVGNCGGVSTSSDVELLLLCDSAPTPNRFLRRFVYDSEGAPIGFTNTTLDGVTPFVPVGAVGICTTPVATDFDFVVLELCDSNGGFLRRLTFNSATGAVTSTVNTTLAGAAYVPVGTVGTCEACCPIVVGEGCSNTGSGRYTALRLTNGTISLIDSVSGAAITGANVVPCAATVTSQLKLLNAGESWTPGGDVTGVLTGVSMTVLTGTANVTDSNGPNTAGIPAGASIQWGVEDDSNTLTGPQLINADAASTVLVNWTQRQ